MNVYDFDETIYSKNSTVAFILWCMHRDPKLWLSFMPSFSKSLVLYKIGKIPTYLMMRHFFSVLGKIDDFDEKIEKFWDENEKFISEWYLKQKRSDDLIISASPTCIIAPIAKRLNIKFVATDYDRETGVFVNNLMYGKGKARYIIDSDFPVIENFYSDSLSDTPIALCAEKAHLVVNKAQKIIDWPHLDNDILKEVRRQLNTGWKIHI
ncbi:MULTISPECIES: haloacid dehalogenase-like hydrolase [unclassified Butyrivibrio]|uniref:haloacid dehalogenase-like hydrolase n=1 Tax=unclassified Butyrivibrio TaxID=2639466 RepID=UPI000677C8CF|nr:MULTISPECIES: haloacid dehalogenase-like hydrolase [unclassified Butyrivibrio]